MVREKVKAILSSKFHPEAVENLLAHYEEVQSCFCRSQYEDMLSETGKFVESALRCLHYLTTGILLDRVDAGDEIERLERSPKNSTDETIRLLIPRVLRPLYQIACNRGARHDRLRFDPNRMDATLAAHGISWVLADLLRYSYAGVVQPAEAQQLVGAIVQPKYQVVEEVDGLTFLHSNNVSARDAILVKLRVNMGRRVSRDELFQTADLHGHTMNNARATLSQLRRTRLVHENADGVRLLAPGVLEADQVLSNGLSKS